MTKSKEDVLQGGIVNRYAGQLSLFGPAIK